MSQRTAHYTRLPDGRWGMRGLHLVRGETVLVRRRDCNVKEEVVGEIVTEDEDGVVTAALVEEASEFIGRSDCLDVCPYCQVHGGDGSRCSVRPRSNRAPQFRTWREQSDYWETFAEHACREVTDLKVELAQTRERWIAELGTEALLTKLTELEARCGAQLRAREVREEKALRLAVREVLSRMNDALALVLADEERDRVDEDGAGS